MGLWLHVSPTSPVHRLILSGGESWLRRYSAVEPVPGRVLWPDGRVVRDDERQRILVGPQAHAFLALEEAAWEACEDRVWPSGTEKTQRSPETANRPVLAVLMARSSVGTPPILSLCAARAREPFPQPAATVVCIIRRENHPALTLPAITPPSPLLLPLTVARQPPSVRPLAAAKMGRKR